MKLSIDQVNWFWRLFGKAWSVYCAGTGADSGEAAKHAWRKDELLSCGFASLTEVDPTQGFNIVMTHFAEIAGDEKTLLHFADANERCLRHAVEKKLLPELCRLEHKALGWAYVQEIARRQNVPAAMDDCTVEHWRGIVSALSRQIRSIKAAREELTPRENNQGLGSRRWHKEANFQHLGAA